jgi:hypothetical protein
MVPMMQHGLCLIVCKVTERSSFYQAYLTARHAKCPGCPKIAMLFRSHTKARQDVAFRAPEWTRLGRVSMFVKQWAWQCGSDKGASFCKECGPKLRLYIVSMPV